MGFLTQVSLKKASVTLLIALALVAAGVYAALHINQELVPNVDFPLVTGITSYPGASPQDVADQVSAPLEGAVAGVSGVRSLQSISAEGLSVVVAEFDFGRDMEQVEQEVVLAVSGVTLPEGAGRPRVTRFNINRTLPVIQLSVAGDMGPEELERFLRRELVPRLQAIEGVESVDLLGGVSRQVDVVLDPVKMRETGITPQQVVSALKAQNLSLSSGYIAGPQGVMPVRTESRLTSLGDLQGLVVGLVEGQGGPRPVRLGDIAQVKVTPSFSGGVSRTNGRPSIGVAVTKAQDANTVKVANAVEEAARQFLREQGGGLDLQVVLDQSTDIEQSIAGLGREGLVGAAAAVVAIWVFLLSFRSALVIAVSIPLSVVVALLALYFGGLTLNVLTLGGLAIAIGRVVDDSIVVLENISRHLQEGEDMGTALREGTREVAGAILGATLTTVAVFLPLGFVGGVVGVLFRPFALTVTFALLASLLVALTVVPVLARFLLPRFRRPPGGPARPLLQRAYLPVLRWALAHRAWTLLIAAVLFFGSFALLPLIPTTFLSSSGEDIFLVNITPPPGAVGGQAMLPAVLEAERIIGGLPGVELYQTTINPTGGSAVVALGRALRGRGTRGATIFVRLKPGVDIQAVEDMARQRLSALKGVLVEVTATGGSDLSSQLQVSVTANDLETARRAGLQVFKALQGVPGLRDLTSSTLASQRALVVRVDPERAARAGLTPAQVAGVLAQVTVPQTATYLTLDGERLPVVVRTDTRALADPKALGSLPVGQGATLASVARLEVVEAPTVVTRLDQRPATVINGTIEGASTGEVSREVQRRIDALGLPPGVEVTYGGVLQQFRESFRTLYVGIAASVVIVYIVMVVVMGSLLNPLVIMFSLPLASIGALAALALTGRALSLPALFGVLMLVGIVVTNAIVLIDFVSQLRGRGYSVRDALLEGGRLRLRPVLMTALTTILALFPVALGFTEGAIIAAELATVVVGGLITSTLLTLVIVPVIYSIAEGLRERFGRRPEA